MPHGGSKEMRTLAASICADYSKAPDNTPAEVRIAIPGQPEIIQVVGIPPKDVKHFLI